MSYILRTYDICKTFNQNEVLSKVNMRINKGEIYGFLGPNGSGKTTMMKLITNLIKPTNGEIELFGEKLTNNSYEVLKRMGSIIEYPVFYEKLTARENLELHCEYMGYYDKKAIDTAAELVNLKNVENKKVREFSLGMKQRLGIARAITTKPEFLILDEPINGLDPAGIKEIRSLIKMLSREYGITILISSHILAEIEQIADTIGVISNGRLIKEITMESVRKQNIEYIELVTKDIEAASFILSNNLKITNFKITDEGVIRIYNGDISQDMILKTLMLKDVSIDAISKKQNSLEDYFIKLIDTDNAGLSKVIKGGELSA